MKFHRKLVKEANRNGSLDLVLLGDSLIEMWNGTSMFGKVAFPKIRLVFDSLFTRTGGGSLDAIALGTAADKVRLQYTV